MRLGDWKATIQKIIDECPRDYLVFAAKQFVRELSAELENNNDHLPGAE